MGDQGTRILLLHGLSGCKENWRNNISCLAESHQVYAVDLPGFGLSDKPSATYTLSYFNQFVCDFMEQLHVDRASVVGHSLGGVIALNLAIQHPERVDKLVLVDSAGLCKAIHPMARLSSLPLLGKLMARQGRQLSRQVAELCHYNPQLIQEQDVELHYQRSTLPGALAALLATVRALVDLQGVRDGVVRPIVAGLHSISATTLIIWGQEDRILPVSQTKVASECVPNAQVLVFEQCGHGPQIECPDKFNAAVLRFLGK